VLVCYAIDKLSLSQLNKYMYTLSEASEKLSAAKLIEQQQIRKMIAQQRPNVLDLLTKINQCRPDGMVLDSFRYRKKDKTATIAGKAGSWEQLYKFEEDLDGKGGISNVKVQNPTSDKGKISFKMTLNYGKVSGKK